MAKSKNPSISIDWDAGEGSLELGTRLEREHPLFKVDVLSDIKYQADMAYQAAFEELMPGQQGRQQREQNLQRRIAVESLVGLTVTAAQPLINGHVVIQWSNGTVTVLCADNSDVNLRAADSIEEAAAFVGEHFGDKYTAEPTPEDLEVTQTTEKNRRIAELAGIETPNI